MKIYIASSWKNEKTCLLVADAFRKRGHEVDCFCDAFQGRFTFNYSEISNLEELNCITFLRDERAHRAFIEDKKWIDWADAIVMLLPCGKSAHLEAGYGKGKGKKLYIIGEFPNGEFDVMYGFADGLFRDYIDLLIKLERHMITHGMAEQ